MKKSNATSHEITKKVPRHPHRNLELNEQKKCTVAKTSSQSKRFLRCPFVFLQVPSIVGVFTTGCLYLFRGGFCSRSTRSCDPLIKWRIYSCLFRPAATSSPACFTQGHKVLSKNRTNLSSKHASANSWFWQPFFSSLPIHPIAPALSAWTQLPWPWLQRLWPQELLFGSDETGGVGC